MDDRDLVFYMSLHYPLTITELSDEEGGGYFAEIRDLPGCMADGATAQEAVDQLKESKELWIATALKRGLRIPLPDTNTEDKYSGRLTLRLPRSLHRKVAEAARHEGVSLNQYLLAAISFNAGVFEIDSKTPREIRVVLSREGDDWLEALSRLLDGTLGWWNSVEKLHTYACESKGVSWCGWEESGTKNWADTFGVLNSNVIVRRLTRT